MHQSSQSSDRPDPGHSLATRRTIVGPHQAAERTPGPSVLGPQVPSGITPAFILYVFGQWWKWVVPAGMLLSALAAIGVLYFHVPEYEAKARMLIESREPYIAFNSDRDHHGDRYVETQIELLRSPVVLIKVLEDSQVGSLPELRTEPDPQSYLAAHLTVQQVGRSDLYEIRFKSDSAEAAAKVVNAVVGVYLEMQRDETFRRSERVINVLEEERLRRSTEVERLRGQVLKLAKEVTGKDPFADGTIMDLGRAMPSASGLFHSLTEVEVEEEVLKAEIDSLRGSVASGTDYAISSGLLDLKIAEHADVRELEDKIEIAEDAIEYLQETKVNWKDDPSYKKVAADLKESEAELTELKKTLRKEVIAAHENESKAQHDELIRAKEQELASLEAKKKLLSSRYEKSISELKSGGAQSVQLEFARSELAREEGVFELIAARKLALQTELRAPPRVSLQQRAAVPFLAIEPIPYKLLALASLSALVTPLALACARELTVRRISNVQQLMQESRLNLLAEIARFPVRPVANETYQLSNSMQRQMFIFAESVDSLRTNLILGLSRNRTESRVIAICSAASSEGKSSVATSLAMSFGSAEKKPTLIIDCDLRSPDVANVLGTRPAPGLAEVLTGKAEPDDAIFRVGNSNSFVMPAGKAKSNPHHIVHEIQFKTMLEKLRTTFSTIILDTPPVLSASEALVFAQAADHVVFCSLVDVSRSNQVRLAVDRLQSTGAKLAGAVLSGTPASRYSYMYGYYGSNRT